MHIRYGRSSVDTTHHPWFFTIIYCVPDSRQTMTHDENSPTQQLEGAATTKAAWPRSSWGPLQLLSAPPTTHETHPTKHPPGCFSSCETKNKQLPPSSWRGLRRAEPPARRGADKLLDPEAAGVHCSCFQLHPSLVCHKAAESRKTLQLHPAWPRSSWGPLQLLSAPPTSSCDSRPTSTITKITQLQALCSIQKKMHHSWLFNGFRVFCSANHD